MKQEQQAPVIGWFVSGHGFGHATRAAAVMDAMHRLQPACEHRIYTSAPSWIFNESLPNGAFSICEQLVDIGLVQNGPMAVDVNATIDALDQWLPFDEALLQRLATDLKNHRCQMVICDISPLGAAVAERAGLPCVLLENFTWAWIYQGYVDQNPLIAKWGERLDSYYQSIALRIQTGAAGVPHSTAAAVGFISRHPRHSQAEVRECLGIPEGKKMVLATLGGIAGGKLSFAAVPSLPDCVFVTAGLPADEHQHDNLIVLPQHEQMFHPDLVAAADVVVCKSGYSTYAECIAAGVPVASVPRPEFPESAVLDQVMQARGGWRSVAAECITDHRWLESVRELLSVENLSPQPNADVTTAEVLLDYLAAH